MKKKLKQKVLGKYQFYDGQTLKKIFRMMRLTVFCFFLGFMQVMAVESYAQMTKLSMKVNNEPLEQVLNFIEDESEFFFLYNRDLIDVEQKVSVNAENKTIKSILDDVLVETDISFVVYDRQIVLTNKEIINEMVMQQNSVSGKVIDNAGQPLPGVTVIIKGTTNGTVTNMDGNYSISNVKEDAVLQFSFVGMKNIEVQVGSQTNVNVTMEEETIGLDEVVAIGYGVVKKSDLTGSVGSIKSEEITATPTTRLDDAIRGKVAGFLSTPTSSEPGASSSIRIRGSNSLSANNEPLLVVDGFVGGFSLNDIDVNSVESVEVLKDASATAIYGSRGSNGVILITTKKGKTGDAKVTWDSFISLQSSTRSIPVLNATQFAEFMNEAKAVEMYPNPDSYGKGTNWQEEIYHNNAPMLNTSVTISGGTEKSKYYMSGNYIDQQGIALSSNMKRYHFTLNTENQIGKKIKVGNSLFISRRTQTPGGFNLNQVDIVGWFPTMPVFDESGNYTYQTETPQFVSDNPVSLSRQRKNIYTLSKILGTVYGEADIINGMKYKLSVGINYTNDMRQQYDPSTLYSQINVGGTAIINNGQTMNVLVENTLTYDKKLEDHNINGLLGYTRQSINNFTSMVQTENFVTDAFEYNNLGAGAERRDAQSNATDEGLISYLFRVNYGFKDKYLVTFSSRLDGASVFAANNKWGFFPSLALAWRAESEPFIQNLNIFSNLKIRASIGQLGNPGLEPGASLSQLSSNGNSYVLGADQHLITGIAANTLGNTDLKWESTTQTDVGIDAGFLKNKLQVTLDFYHKMTDNLLVQVPLLWLTSFETSLSNYGSVSNNGLELVINSVNVKKRDFSWTTSFNISGNRNKIMKLYAPEGFILTNSLLHGPPSGILQEGLPIGSFYGLKQDGIWNSQQEINESGLSGYSVFPGGKRYVDINGDKVIDNSDDRTVIGNAEPKFFGGLGNRLTYKRFEIYCYLSFVYGNDIYNEANAIFGTAFDQNVYAKFSNRWTPENQDTDVPSIDAISRSYITSSSDMVEDGSFLRLRDIRLTYNIPVNKVKWINSAQVYFTGTNLLLFDHYSGYDPEINNGTSNTRRGYDVAQNPTLKSYTFGLKFDF